MLLQIAARDIGQLTDIKCMFICKIKLRVHMQVQNAAIGGIDHHRYAVRLYRHAAGGYPDISGCAAGTASPSIDAWPLTAWP